MRPSMTWTWLPKTALLLLSFHLIVAYGRKLTREDFDEILDSNYYLFVKFYAPNCGHCQKLAPIWDKLEAKMLSIQTSRVIIGSVDCNEERDLCSRESVMGVPTLKLYKSHESNGVEYEGERNLMSLEGYLRAQLGDQLVDGTDELTLSVSSEESPDTPKPINGMHELDDDSIEQFLSRGRHFVDFYAPWCGHCQLLAPIWDQLALSFEHDTSVKISKLDCTTNALSCKKYEIKGYPTLLWIVDGKVVDKYTGSRSHEDFKQFISDKKNEETIEKIAIDLSLDSEDDGPLILTEETFGRTVKKGLTFVKFWVPWCSHCKRLRPVWHTLSTKFFGNRDVKITSVDCAQYESLCNKEQVDGYPTLFLYKDDVKVGEYDGERTLEEMHEFVVKQWSGPEKDEL